MERLFRSPMERKRSGMKLWKTLVWSGLSGIIPAAHAAHQVSLPASLAAAGVQVVDVHVGLSYSEGPAVDPAGNLFFSEDPDVNTGKIWKITPQGVKSVYKDPSRGSNGLEFDNQGRLHIAMLDSVLRIEPDGQTAVTVLHSSKSGTSIGRVNDLSINSAGALFFTNLSGNTLFFRNTARRNHHAQLQRRQRRGMARREIHRVRGFRRPPEMQDGQRHRCAYGLRRPDHHRKQRGHGRPYRGRAREHLARQLGTGEVLRERLHGQGTGKHHHRRRPGGER